MTSRSEAILHAILERCSRHREGYQFNPALGVIRALVKAGLVVIQADGRVVTTAKGISLLRALELKIEPDRKRKLAAIPSRRRNVH